MKPEQRIKRRVAILLDCVNVSEVSRRAGYPRSTLQNWKRDPLSIPAVCLETLEDLLGKERYVYDSKR